MDSGATRQPAESSGLAGGGRAVVLVVDDDPNVRRALRIVLDEEFDTVEADRGHEALRRLRTGRVDAVLLDVLLPDVDGLEVLRLVRHAEAPPPVVVVSGVTVLRTAVEAMKLGAVDYVAKPFAVDDLLAAVRAALRRARSGARGRAVAPSPAPAAVVGGDAAVQAGLALLLGDVAPVERFGLPARALRTRDLVCAVLLVERGVDPAAVGAALESQATRTAVFVATREPWPAHVALPVEPTRVFPLADWSGLVTAIRRHLAPDLPGLGRHVGQAAAYMAAHHDRALSVGDVAAAVGVSESHLAHLFPAETAFTVRRFLRALRLELARDLVAQGDDKLETIARRLAFADGAHLSRALRRAPGRRESLPEFQSSTEGRPGGLKRRP
jgi:CheY-like chemotaxis protein/AraC-like DNA-binding protein